jgi:UDP-glucose 4-epimerase
MDVVHANWLAMSYDKPLLGEIFNIGSGTNFSIIEICNMISSNVEFIGDRMGEARETLADISKAREWIGYSPKHSLATYIKQQISNI